ncbi:MAG: LdpA C-terminal domain-containing domain, partial [Synechococcales cyanobacterium]
AGGTNHYTVPKLRTMGLLPPLPSTSIQPNIGQKLSEVTPWISGVAYGSYARVLLSPVLDELASREDERYSYPLSSIPMTTSVGKEITATPSVIAQGGGRFPRLEAYPDLLWKSVRLAYSLINQLK